MIHFKSFKFYLIIFFVFSACSSVPKNTQNSCEIFEERYLWYKHTKSSYEKWGAPIHLQLAFVKKESDFNWLAKPPREKLLILSPLKGHQVHLGTHKLLLELGNNIKKKQIIS